MKKCIWCNKTEADATFKKLAHIVPQSLGGESICKNVCDDCNLFFGSASNHSPAIETTIKETFNVSRAIFLNSIDEIGKHKYLARFKSIYFDVDFEKKSLKLKSAYKFHQYFQEKLSRQLKKGLYKIFLEYTEMKNGDGHSDKYDFIREFCRYDLGDYPLFYFERINPLFFMSTHDLKAPCRFLREEMRSKYLADEPSFYEFELLGHVFGIATSRHWDLVVENYLKKTIEVKSDFFKSWKLVNNFNDIDLLLRILNNK